MVILSKKNMNNIMKLSIAMVVTAVVFFLLGGLITGEFSFASYGYFELIAIVALLSGGISGILNIKKHGKRFEKYFEQGSTMTVTELATELGYEEKVVRKYLELFVSKKERKNLKQCESVKFEA